VAENRNTVLLCKSIGLFNSGVEIAGKIQKAFAESNDVFFYCETVNECVLERRNPLDITFLNDFNFDYFEGRVFNKNIDIRWVKGPDGRWRAWETSESKSIDAIQATATERRYYLLGEWEGWHDTTNRIGEFSEGRYPGKIFKYPMPDDKEPQRHDRTYIDVIEYRRVAPEDWNQVQDINAELNEPMLCGHRFVGVGVGRGK
jgi:hypothetical protein